MSQPDGKSQRAEPAAKIGPGRLILVVGPSGAGKDSLLSLAAAASGDGFVVVRRVVTRPSSGAEEHDTLSDAGFDEAAAAGIFTVWWTAHGNKYGIPVSTEAAVRAGRTVLCNVSRGAIGEFRRRFAAVSVVLVTAPTEILAQRLAARDRASDAGIAARLARADAAQYRVDADLVIDNTGTLDAAAKEFLDFVRQS
jgi:ribose 1,5-bisphosphokinase